MVHWLRRLASNAGAWAQSLVGELRSYKLRSVVKKRERKQKGKTKLVTVVICVCVCVCACLCVYSTCVGVWLQMVTAARKLKDAYSLERKLCPTWQHIEKQRHYFANKGPSSQGYGFSRGDEWTTQRLRIIAKRRRLRAAYAVTGQTPARCPVWPGLLFFLLRLAHRISL